MEREGESDGERGRREGGRAREGSEGERWKGGEREREGDRKSGGENQRRFLHCHSTFLDLPSTASLHFNTKEKWKLKSMLPLSLSISLSLKGNI